MNLKAFQLADTHNLSLFPGTINILKQKLLLPLYRIVSLLRREAWILTGVDARCQHVQSILYSGRPKDRAFIGKLFFGDSFEIKYIGHRWLWQLLTTKRETNSNCCFSIVGTRWQFTKYLSSINIFCIPTWVYGHVDINDFDEHRKSSKQARYNFNKIKKNHLRYEITKDPLHFDEFYYKMFKEYISKRHGACSLIESYNHVKATFSKYNGEILFVTKGNQRIAGLMICYDKDTAKAYRLGVVDGNFQFVKEGAISALYYYTIQHCRSKGFRKLSLGGSRPFLSDGVLNYKLRNLNMKIDGHSKAYYLIFKPLDQSNFTKDFLFNNPFISLKKQNLFANTFRNNSFDQSHLIKR